MKNRIIQPRLAGGVCFLFYLLVLSTIENITGFPILTEHGIIPVILFMPVGIIILNKYAATYNEEKNDNVLFTVIGLITGVLLLVSGIVEFPRFFGQ